MFDDFFDGPAFAGAVTSSNLNGEPLTMDQLDAMRAKVLGGSKFEAVLEPLKEKPRLVVHPDLLVVLQLQAKERGINLDAMVNLEANKFMPEGGTVVAMNKAGVQILQAYKFQQILAGAILDLDTPIND